MDPAAAAYFAGLEIAKRLPICNALLSRVEIIRDKRSQCPRDGWAIVYQSGRIDVHPSRRGEPKEWAYVLAHCVLHLGFDHFAIDREGDRTWQAACDVVIERFLNDLKAGASPFLPIGLPGGSEEAIYRNFKQNGVPPEIFERGMGGEGPDMIFDGPPRSSWYYGATHYPTILARGLVQAVEDAVEIAAGYRTATKKTVTTAQRAQKWFLSSFPLLGAMAAAFTLVEDPKICQRLNIAVAAVDAAAREIFMNPAAAMDELECRFVIAHEILHVGLRHQERCAGRDPFLWNVACDFVINGWLLEMGVGAIPSFGGLHDPELKGLNAEAIYDRIVRDIRTYRKLATVRGVGLCDILGPADGLRGASVDLDDFYRRALAQGLSLHQQKPRGLLPAGLVEEIEALSVPPIPWDVRLAQWFDGYFGPLESRRTYSRASRRQSATPDIPRPRVVEIPESALERTFGVVLDTSGSMSASMLAQALGTVSSYAMSRQVPFVRLIFCDAATYDEGYLPPEAIAGRVRVRGRGGTVLQPGIDLLERAADFPKDGPILIITDAECDRFRSRRDHAIVVPIGARLPFVPHCPVFEMEKP
ncbi:hypothetical protein OP10G_2135 [Fimbriimonas ginsengisoli Gsoil 348]|uniref:Uncharacterized protein n=2 Tax=Fimbriimonas ginsengisoli TaxID=1005039 RepID=A0A068NPN1_FIMGI|nr:hypothetical protein OP10G_2135 [Fimbriimonas ginsengisoli Gsoil 348]